MLKALSILLLTVLISSCSTLNDVNQQMDDLFTASIDASPTEICDHIKQDIAQSREDYVGDMLDVDGTVEANPAQSLANSILVTAGGVNVFADKTGLDVKDLKKGQSIKLTGHVADLYYDHEGSWCAIYMNRISIDN